MSPRNALPPSPAAAIPVLYILYSQRAHQQTCLHAIFSKSPTAQSRSNRNKFVRAGASAAVQGRATRYAAACGNRCPSALCPFLKRF